MNALAYPVTVIGAGWGHGQDWVLCQGILHDCLDNPQPVRTASANDHVDKNNAVHCKSTDFVVIWNNFSEWAGTADSAETRALIIHGYKDALEREKK